MGLTEPLNKGIGEAPTPANAGWQAKPMVAALKRSAGRFTHTGMSHRRLVYLALRPQNELAALRTP